MAHSQNGWPASPNLATRVIQPVPGIALRIVDNQEVADIFTYLCQQYDKRIESLAKGKDDWGFAYRPNVNSPNEISNHGSGTALDLNAEKHPNAVATNRTFTIAKIAEIHKILKELGGTIRWGGDYHHIIDSMHFEVQVLPHSSLLTTIAAKVRHIVPLKPISVVAGEVIAGQWGDGDERKKRLVAAGYNYTEVQTMVTKILSAHG